MGKLQADNPGGSARARYHIIGTCVMTPVPEGAWSYRGVFPQQTPTRIFAAGYQAHVYSSLKNS